MSRNSANKGPKVVISGYYGFDNCGDEAVLLAMIHCLKNLKPDINIVVLSGNPKKTQELYAVNAVNRWNPVMVAFEILSCRLVLSGGGSLLQDVTSSVSLRYYLAIIKLAAMLKKRVMIYSQGIGPLNAAKNRARVSKALNRCYAITVRDKLSAELLKEIGVKRDIQVTCDPVMALDIGDFVSLSLIDGLLGSIIPGYAAEDRKPIFMAAVRLWNNNSHIAPIAEFLDTLAKSDWNVLLVPAHHPHDMEAIERISGLMASQPYILDKCLTAREFLALTAQSDMVFSMRLHGLICAMAAGTPMLGLSYDPKVDAFMDQAGLSRYCLPFAGFSCESAMVLLKELEALPPGSLQLLESRRRELRDMARVIVEQAVALL